MTEIPQERIERAAEAAWKCNREIVGTDGFDMPSWHGAALDVKQRWRDFIKAALTADAVSLPAIDSARAEIEKWKGAYRRTGGCMSCAINGAPEPYGCTDCLNTGWDGGEPAEATRARAEEREACARIADDHRGVASRIRLTKGFAFTRMSAEAQDEIVAEERGEDIAAEIIAKAIRARTTKAARVTISPNGEE